MGHKFYNIERRNDLIQSVNNIITKTYNNYTNYKNKIIGMINDQNINQLSKQLILKPNVVLSYITSIQRYEIDYTVPLLYLIGLFQNNKMIELFLDCLFHYSDVILKQKYEKNNDDKHSTFWLKKYLNFVQCKFPIIDDRDVFVKYRYTVHI